jgi:hypothetical protein
MLTFCEHVFQLYELSKDKNMQHATTLTTTMQHTAGQQL